MRLQFIKRLAYDWDMELSEYLSKRGDIANLARGINAQSQLVWQWTRGVRKVPIERCMAIERFTSGIVTRQDLRPDDWAAIWPELAAGCDCLPDQAQVVAASAQPAIETVAKEGADV